MTKTQEAKVEQAIRALLEVPRKGLTEQEGEMIARALRALAPFLVPRKEG